LEYIRGLLNLPKLFGILERFGFKSHDCVHSDRSNKAGFHIHVNNASFGLPTHPKIRNKAMAYFTYLWQKPEFRTQIKKFSRRNKYRYCEFYDSNYFAYGTIQDGYKRILAYNKTSRDRVVNFHKTKYVNGHFTTTRLPTIEVRIMRGTNKVRTVIASVELVDVFATIACAAKKDEDVKNLTWKDICSKVPATHTNLKEYLKKKHLWEE
jgi:hypothetical protein